MDCTRTKDLKTMTKSSRKNRKKMKPVRKTYHKCTRVNTANGKVCNTLFSRSYDLIRHYTTKHATVKTNFICDICSTVKIFSRHDALVRHRRIKHNLN